MYRDIYTDIFRNNRAILMHAICFTLMDSSPGMGLGYYIANTVSAYTISFVGYVSFTACGGFEYSFA